MSIRHLIAGASFTLALVATPSFAITPGEQAPDFAGADTHGERLALNDFKGKYVVLEWVNPHCPFVGKHYDSGNMQKLQSAYRDEGVAWISIKSNSPDTSQYTGADEMNQWLQDMKAQPTTLLMDTSTDIARLYGAKTTPHMFIVDPEGRIIYAGAIDDTRSVSINDVATAKNYVKAALEQALAGDKVTIPSTQPYGCAVKYE